MTNTPENRISELEQEIQKHKHFLERESLFTVVGVDERYNVKGYGVSFDTKKQSLSSINPRGEPIGLLTRKLDSDPYSIHFQDNTDGEIFQYLPRIKIETNGELDIEYVTKNSYYAGNGYTSSSSYCCTRSPAIVILPSASPIDFYMEWVSGHDPLSNIKEFKEYIQLMTNDKISCAESKIIDLQRELKNKEESAKHKCITEEKNRKIYEEFKTKAGLKI